MSHLHHISGQSDIADHYRIFLERSQATRQNGGKNKVRKKSEAKASEAPLDPDQNAGGNHPRESEDEEETDSEDGTEPAGGFGKHYA
jgi:hypothetical protein